MKRIPRSLLREKRRKRRKPRADGLPHPPREPYKHPAPMPPGMRRANMDGTPRKVRSDAGVPRGPVKKKRRQRADAGTTRADTNIDGTERRPWGDTAAFARWKSRQSEARRQAQRATTAILAGTLGHLLGGKLDTQESEK